MAHKRIPVAVVQYAPVFLNIDKCVDKACGLIEEAAGKGARIIAFPETWLPGYPVWIDSSPEAALWGHKPTHAIYRILMENSLIIPWTTCRTIVEDCRDNESICYHWCP